MWCYQKPGFEALLLAELQKQQQCSQFCDTLLKAGGVSVPAHSCVLSAVSPHISSALSSTPVPPAGQTRLLEFRAVGACTMLHMVRLLYSGEMAGEGEKEKEEAISAAAKLGIQGLVEVTKKDLKSRNEEERVQHTEAGVQTEPLIPGERVERRGGWRREEKEGCTVLWKEIPSDGQKDICTQTEELQINTAPPTHPAASFKTIDVSAVQGLGQTASNLVPPQIPYVPISLVYQPDENETPHPSSDPAASMQDSTLPGSTSVAVVTPPYTSVPLSFHSFPNQATTSFSADAQGWWTCPPAANRDIVAGEEWEDEQLKQFQGNIPGFISHFLNPDKEEGSRKGQAGRRRGGRVRGARRAGMCERRARRPRGRPGGRGRGGLTQMVDVQDVGVSKLQKLFLQRGGVRTSRPGQGGGAVGRKLNLKTRELLKPARSCQRRRRRCKEWEFSQSGEVLRFTEGGGRDNKQSTGRNTAQQIKQDIPSTGRAWRARAKPTASLSLSTPPMQFYSVQTLSGSTASLQHSLCPSLFSPAAAYASPASSLLHTTSLPPPPAPHHEEQPEHIDRLLEEVMMGLDILTNNNAAPHSDSPEPNNNSSSVFVSSRSDLTKNCSVARSSGSSCANSEVPIRQQQEEGELTDILDHFLQSFEQHIDNCSAREKEEIGGESSTKTSQPYTVLSKYRKTKTQTISPHTPHLHNTRRLEPARRSQTTELQQSDKAETQLSRSPTRKAAACCIVPPKHAGGTSGKARAPGRPQKKRRTSQYMFSLEIKKKKKSVSSTDRKPRISPDRDKQLQQKPVVTLERNCPLPVKVTLQDLCQSREAKVTNTFQNPAKTKTSSSAVNYPCDSLLKKSRPVWRSTKIYPIRSRLREANIMDSLFEEPTLHKSCRRRCRPKKNKPLPSLSDCEAPQIQLLPVKPCDVEEQLEKNNQRHGEDLSVQPQEDTEGPAKRGKKRGAELEEETSDDATVIKKVCFEQTAPSTAETCIPSSDSADFGYEAAAVEVEDVIDVETVSLISLQTEDGKKAVWSEIITRDTEDSLFDEEMESGSDEIIDVDEDSDGITDLEKDRDNCKEQAEKGCCQSRLTTVFPDFISPPSHSAIQVSLGSTGSWEDEDVDVIGGSSPLPDPVIIIRRESSEGEEEEGDKDLDVVSEKTDSSQPLQVLEKVSF